MRKRVPLNGTEPVKLTEQERLDEQWKIIAAPSIAAEEEAEAERREQERNGLWEAWGWTPPQPERPRWPTRTDGETTFASRVRDIEEVTREYEYAAALAQRRGR